MLSLEQISGFLLAAILITMSPGPDNLMVLGLGMSKGRKQGIAFGVGCAFGCLSHTLWAVIGVTAVIAASKTAFVLLKIGGGLYLMWLGVNAMRSRGVMKINGIKTNESSLPRLFIKGVFANAINPKVMLFFISFLPQFVIAEHGHVSWQTAALGTIFTIQAAVLFGLLGFFSGAVGQWLSRKPRAGIWLDRIAGAIFISLGLRLIVFR